MGIQEMGARFITLDYEFGGINIPTNSTPMRTYPTHLCCCRRALRSSLKMVSKVVISFLSQDSGNHMKNGASNVDAAVLIHALSSVKCKLLPLFHQH